MISMKNMEKMELKTGPGLRDTISHKLFKKEDVIEEIFKLGFYSEFHGFKQDIEVSIEFLILHIYQRFNKNSSCVL